MFVIMLLVLATLVKATEFQDSCELRPWLPNCQSEEDDSDVTDDHTHTSDPVRSQEADLPLPILSTLKPKSRVSQGYFPKSLLKKIVLIVGNLPDPSLQMLWCALLFASNLIFP